MRILLLCIFWILAVNAAWGKDIDIICSGNGPTKEDAVNDALMNAIEQTCGSFVSANTSIFNDELVKDELVSLKKGSIRKYKIISDFNPSTRSVTIETEVSPERITQFVENHGSVAELAGETFGTGLKLYKLNLSNAVVAMEHLFISLSEISKKMYDYKLEAYGPILVGNEAWVPVVVRCYLNKNGMEFYLTYNKTTSAIYKILRETKPYGTAVFPDLDKVHDYDLFCQFLPELQCFGFTISDNIGSKIYTHLAMDMPPASNPFAICWPIQYIGDDYKACVNRGYNQNIIDFFDGRRVTQDNKQFRNIGGIRLRIASWGISVDPLKASNISDPLWRYREKMAKLRNPSYPSTESFKAALRDGYGYIEIPYHTYTLHSHWWKHRYSEATLGDLNGSFHLVLKYPVDKIERVSRITASPNASLF